MNDVTAAKMGTIAAVLATLAMGLVGWAVLGGGRPSPGKDPADNPSAYEPSRADKAAIRTWLKENLGEPQWEEIKWYPCVSIKDIARHEMERSKTIPNPLSRESTIELNEARLKGDDYKICQVKLRAKWVLGIPSVKKAIFRIANGKAEPQGYFDEYFQFVPVEDRGLVTDHW